MKRSAEGYTAWQGLAPVKGAWEVLMSLIEAVHGTHEDVERGICGRILSAQSLPQYLVFAVAAKLLTERSEADQPACGMPTKRSQLLAIEPRPRPEPTTTAASRMTHILCVLHAHRGFDLQAR